MKLSTLLILITFCFPWIINAQQSETDLTIGRSFTFQSQILQEERKLQVFLPEGYDQDNQSYPVLYLLDGDRYFLYAVNLERSFVSFNQSSEFIIVGISKTKTERNANFSYNSAKFQNYIEEEVISFVDKQFRTSRDRLIFGWAYGGSFVFESMVSNPTLFEAYLAASPFPLQSKFSAVDSLITVNPTFDKLLYFTCGTQEGVVTEGTDLMNQLLTDKAPLSLNWSCRKMDDEEHRSTPYPTLYHGLRKYFAYYPELQFSSLEDFEASGGLDYVRSYYKKRAQQFGFSDTITDWTMFSLTRNAIRAENFEQFERFLSEFETSGFIDRLRVSRACVIAEFYLKNEQAVKSIELFTQIAENNADSPRPMKGIGDAYLALNKKKKANLYYQKAKELSE